MTHQIIRNFTGLNFSGDESSWFDLWHAHTECENVEGFSWNKRAICVQEFIELYRYFQTQLVNYPKPFQLWIEIWENDSAEDAVYIHTRNPNSNNFPVKVGAGVEPEISDTDLIAWFKKQHFEIIIRKMLDDNVIYLYSNEVGIPLNP